MQIKLGHANVKTGKRVNVSPIIILKCVPSPCRTAYKYLETDLSLVPEIHGYFIIALK